MSKRLTYYPRGDRDPVSRRTREDLVLNGSDLMFSGSETPLDEDYRETMLSLLEGNVSKLYEKDADGEFAFEFDYHWVIAQDDTNKVIGNIHNETNL